MNEEEFLKEHPSLKGRCINEFESREVDGDGNRQVMVTEKTGWKFCYLDAIHKTQIDKQKITEKLLKVKNRLDTKYDGMIGTDEIMDELEKELGVDKRLK